MSRIGRNPITVPAGVDVNVGEGNFITVKGPLGTLEFKFSDILTFKKDGDTIIVDGYQKAKGASLDQHLLTKEDIDNDSSDTSSDSSANQ